MTINYLFCVSRSVASDMPVFSSRFRKLAETQEFSKQTWNRLKICCTKNKMKVLRLYCTVSGGVIRLVNRIVHS